MILLADSGSTKTEWCLAGPRGKIGKRLFTSGINPYYMNKEEIQRTIDEELYPHLRRYHDKIEAIHFYGAGCAYPEKNDMVAAALRRHWQVPVSVESDLLAAAHALCGHEAGIACILGTGSNSCVYDGEKIVQHIDSLGLILGDEGSGGALGRVWARDCLRGDLIEPIIRKFMKEYHLTPELIMEKVYRQPFPNRFLASFAPFIKKHLDNEYVYGLVYDNFKDFVIRHLYAYDALDFYAVHFVGSIAYQFQDILRKLMDDRSLETGTIAQSPMEGLIKYHTED